MDFQLSDVLKAIGPTASIIFAAWIFLSFLQSRCDAALTRYRDLLGEYRKGEDAERAASAKREIEVYARRCTIMSWAVTLGLVSALRWQADTSRTTLAARIGRVLMILYGRCAPLQMAGGALVLPVCR